MKTILTTLAALAVATLATNAEAGGGLAVTGGCRAVQQCGGGGLAFSGGYVQQQQVYVPQQRFRQQRVVVVPQRQRFRGSQQFVGVQGGGTTIVETNNGFFGIGRRTRVIQTN